MRLTRSIRRKLTLGFALVGGLLVALSLIAFSGLRWYRNAVDDLDFVLNEAPRRAELAETIGGLFEPLLIAPQARPEALRFQQAEFRERLERTRAGVLDFRGRLELLPRTPTSDSRRTVTEALLAEIDRRLARLDSLQEGLADADRREASLSRMLREIAHLETLSQQVPDSRDGLARTLARSREIYKSRVRWVAGTSIAAVVLFGCLVFFGYRWIFVPIRKLHRGASRVAQGDFDYRVELNTGDEIAELAESFNKMTARFQEIRRDLDQQVRDRSRQLVRSERLAGVGFLAAGVAHEINNPLSAIAMAAESLEGRVDSWLPSEDDDAEIVREYLRMIQTESFRCRDITNRLLDFSRTQDTARGRHDLAGIVSEVLTMVRLGKYRGRRIEFDPVRSCWAEVNGSEIKQVVLNLVANALEAMPADGKLRIEAVERTDEVVLTFADDGRGMTPEVVEHLFEPFFTQRESGKGTGLGLAISHRIIADHGGTIEAFSEGPGQGSTFRVHLPRQTADRAAA